MADNPTCPKCGHYNAMIDYSTGGVNANICRDCGHITDDYGTPLCPVCKSFDDVVPNPVGNSSHYCVVCVVDFNRNGTAEFPQGINITRGTVK